MLSLPFKLSSLYVSPLNQEVSRHDVITFTTIAAFWVKQHLIGRSRVLIRKQALAQQGVNHDDKRFIIRCHIKTLQLEFNLVMSRRTVYESPHDGKLIITVKRKYTAG